MLIAVFLGKSLKVFIFIHTIPQYIEVPLNIEAIRIIPFQINIYFLPANHLNLINIIQNNLSYGYWPVNCLVTVLILVNSAEKRI